MRYTLPFIFLLTVVSAKAQNDTTVKVLEGVEVKAFNISQPVFTMPATVSVLDKAALAAHSSSSWVPVFNSVAGIRMEERSPGSYRLSLRGSLLRSPFGIRNIKMYWNGLPLTDAGGNTYFNLLDRSATEQIEVLKGPAGSIYGSGTGGVILLTEPDSRFSDATKGWHGEAELSGGSYGLFTARAAARYTGEKNMQDIRLSHQQSDGYRDNSALRRTTATWKGTKQNGNFGYSWLLNATDLYYQTPGGLTLAQFKADPRKARPATPTLPSAEQQKAAIYNKQIFSGIHFRYEPSGTWNYYAGISATYVDFTNPFITNYEKRAEPGFTGRGGAIYRLSGRNYLLKAEGGMEYGYQSVGIRNFKNNGGVKEALMYDDQIRTGYFFPFIQGVLRWKNVWTLQTGMSYNVQGYAIKRKTGDDIFHRKDNTPQWMPRLALQRTLSERFSVYGLISKGYSPPSAAEVRPSDGSVRDELQPESGWNRELGVRYRSRDGRIRGSVQGFRFGLEQTIVRRIADNGGEYFVNAGATIQQGIETEWQTTILPAVTTGQSRLGHWIALSWYDFRFREYKIDNSDYSGNKVTGVPDLSLSTGLDFRPTAKWSFHLVFAHTGSISLNDQHNESADAYQLLNFRVQKTCTLSSCSLTLFAGADNLLNQHYSLGNDLNAVGKRYYNAAPLRNYEFGVRLAR